MSKPLFGKDPKAPKYKLDRHADLILKRIKEGRKKIDIVREITVLTGKPVTRQTLTNWLKTHNIEPPSKE